MKIDYKKYHRITYSETDQNLKLGLMDAFNLVQDMTTEYFETFGADNVNEKEKANAAWVLARKKIHFNRYPKWGDKLNARSYITNLTHIRIGLETAFLSKNKEVLFICKEESCPIDIDTRKIRKIDSIVFPSDIETEESNLNDNFLKLNETFTEDDFVCERNVYVSDLDYSRHVNNARYIKYLIDTFDSNFFDKNEIVDFEIQYKKEAKENECLKIYKKVIENEVLFLIKESDIEIVRAYSKFRNLEIN